VAETVKRSIREVDLVGRYGGEEFAVFLIETDESGAFFVAERIRRAVAERTYRAYDEDLRVTVSIGCATRTRPEETPASILDAADAALYEAKRLGKNRVHLSSMGFAPDVP
ncbi:MAG TPA: GGDEF domain-containing protein, partial [Thermomicrobiales bacterium]|nr:GGDEF domain-containing protein [Thermomicrobiales bacterium]